MTADLTDAFADATRAFENFGPQVTYSHRAFQEFFRRLDANIDESVRHLSPAEITMYQRLLREGVPRLDALCTVKAWPDNS
jgi:hypothetical protein